MPSIGNRLYSWRHTYRWTQQRVADELGVTVRTIGRWERGEDAPGPLWAYRLDDLIQRPPEGWRRDA